MALFMQDRDGPYLPVPLKTLPQPARIYPAAGTVKFFFHDGSDVELAFYELSRLVDMGHEGVHAEWEESQARARCSSGRAA
jgi:hypothetical protein